MARVTFRPLRTYVDVLAPSESVASNERRFRDQTIRAIENLQRQVQILEDQMVDVQTRLAAAEVTIEDHETRITALEP